MANDWEPGMPRKTKSHPRNSERLVADTSTQSADELARSGQVRTPRLEASDPYVAANQDTCMAALLEEIAGVDDDIFIKATPGNFGKSWYLTATWRAGPWYGHYVMAVVTRFDLESGIRILARKVAGVRSGALVPSPDKYYQKTTA